MNICVFGAASDRIHPEYIEAGERLGQEMARRGHVLIFGAGSTGMMGAVSRGVHAGGGKLIGVSPTFFDKAVLDLDCSELFFTETMRQRKQKMEELADAFVTLPGSIGTLEEFFEILVLKQLDRHHKPIFLLNTRGFFDGLVSELRHLQEEQFLGPTGLTLFTCFDDPIALLDALEAPGGAA